MAIKSRMVEEKYVVCDFCGKEFGCDIDMTCFDICSACGKHVCPKCIAASEDEGRVCKSCSDKGYQLIWDEFGGQGTYLQLNGVKMPMKRGG